MHQLISLCLIIGLSLTGIEGAQKVRGVAPESKLWFLFYFSHGKINIYRFFKSIRGIFV